MAAWFVKAKTGPTGWRPRAWATRGSLAGLARASFKGPETIDDDDVL